MFGIDTFEFDLNRHFLETATGTPTGYITNTSSGSSDYFLFSDSDSCSGYNSDQENTEDIKE